MIICQIVFFQTTLDWQAWPMQPHFAFISIWALHREVFLNNPFLSQYMCIPFNFKSFWLPTRRRSRNNANVIRLNTHNLHLSTSTPDIVAVQDTVDSYKELNQTCINGHGLAYPDYNKQALNWIITNGLHFVGAET